MTHPVTTKISQERKFANFHYLNALIASTHLDSVIKSTILASDSAARWPLSSSLVFIEVMEESADKVSAKLSELLLFESSEEDISLVSLAALSAAGLGSDFSVVDELASGSGVVSKLSSIKILLKSSIPDPTVGSNSGEGVLS